MPDATVDLAIYRHFVAHGTAPTRAALAGGRVTPSSHIVHVGVPAAPWWADSGFT